MDNIRRYDIVKADLSGSVGSEQGGVRPVLVIQNDVGNTCSCTTIVMPLTSRLKRINQPTHTLIKKSIENGLLKDSMVVGEQIRTIDQKRIIKKIGTVVNARERKEIRRVYNAIFGE